MAAVSRCIVVTSNTHDTGNNDVVLTSDFSVKLLFDNVPLSRAINGLTTAAFSRLLVRVGVSDVKL